MPLNITDLTKIPKMYNYMTSCFIIIQLCIIVGKAQINQFDTLSENADYVDPHSFYYDKNTKTERLPQNNDGNNLDHTSLQVDSCEACLNKCNLQKTLRKNDISDEILSRRLVSMLMSRANFKKEDSSFVGHIELEASELEFNSLKQFAAGSLLLREIDPILNRVLKAPNVNRIYETVVTMQMLISEFITHMKYHKEIIIGFITVIYLYWMLRNVKWTFRKILSISIPIILVASFFISWWKLIEEARIKHVALQVKHMNIPAQCKPDSMNLMDRLRSYVYTDDCEKYYEAVMKNPHLQVTPAQALTHMVAHMLYEPIAVSGKTIARFLNDVTANIPFPFNYVAQVTVGIGLIPMLIFALILLAGGSLNLGFGPLSFFSLRGPTASDRRRNQHHESMIDRRPIENMPNVTLHVHIQDSVRVETTNSDRSYHLAINAASRRSEESNKVPSKNNSESGETSDQSNRLAVSSISGICNTSENIEISDNSKTPEKSSEQGIENDDLASGDWTSANKSNSEIKSGDSKDISHDRKPIKIESGSGDN